MSLPDSHSERSYLAEIERLQRDNERLYETVQEQEDLICELQMKLEEQ